MIDYIEKNISLTSSFESLRGSGDQPPLVAILLCTYNGERFLSEQLSSIQDQIHQNWILVVSEDGSKDATLQILRQYQDSWPQGKMIIRRGPQRGFCQNFLSLACDATISADYFAFCDQDDVWLPDKLSIALGKLQAIQKPHLPLLYCGRTTYVSEQLRPCGNSPLFTRRPSFRNALVQSVAGGNTMVLNSSAKVLIEKAGPQDVPSHDWWIYQLISGAGGEVYYDPAPQILYRQHEGALVGGNSSGLALIRRMLLLFQGHFQNWTDDNTKALQGVYHLLTTEHQSVLKVFVTTKNGTVKDRLSLVKRCGLYRQTKRGMAALYLAALFGKI